MMYGQFIIPDMAAWRAFSRSVTVLRYTSAANLVILSNDVSLNPGPTGPSLHSWFSSSSSFSDESSLDNSRFSSVFVSPNDTFDSSIMLENCNDISPHFDLGLDDKVLKIGHWNVNRLSSEKN